MTNAIMRAHRFCGSTGHLACLWFIGVATLGGHHEAIALLVAQPDIDVGRGLSARAALPFVRDGAALSRFRDRENNSCTLGRRRMGGNVQGTV